MSLRRRVESLESGGASARAPEPEKVSGTAAEVREIDRHIRKLETEIEEVEGGMSPEVLEESRRAAAEWEARAGGLPLDELIALLEAEIAALEVEEGGGGVR